MNLREFAEQTVILGGRPFSLARRPYLDAVYHSTASNMVIRASRQVEKSTFLVNRILYDAVRRPGIQILFVSPRLEQARLFSNVRLRGTLMDSPILRRLLWSRASRLPTTDLQFDNGSRVFIRSAFHKADAVRGISVSRLLIDEFQDLAPGELPVLQETLSHAADPRLFLTGTPKLIDNHLEASYNASTAWEWQVVCAHCQHANIMDERILGPTSLICGQCQEPLDTQQGHWVARNPASTWGDGFWINHLMVPWMDAIKVSIKQQEYDPVRFENEVLGLPTNIGEHMITREEMEACCESRGFARTLAQIPAAARTRLVAGLDWGFGGEAATVLVIGYIDPGRIFRVVRLDRWTLHTDFEQVLCSIARLCREFQIRFIAADGGGGGRTNNRLLLDRLRVGNSMPHLYSIFYADTDHEPKPEGVLWQWTVNRSSTIGTLFTRIKKRLLLFPNVGESGSFLDDFTCVVAVYDPEARRTRFTRAETHRDDALHATNYAELVGLRMRDAANV
jgi:hypothetical protein